MVPTKERPATKTIATNREARHEYFVLEALETGVELKGTEVKSLRAGGVNLKDSWVDIEDGEIVDIILDIHRIEDYCEGGEYSRAGEWEADMRGTFGHDAGNGYNRGNSYANRGRHYVRGHYSRTDGRERMISDIEDMMQEATGAERDAYKRAADILRNA